MSEWSLRRDRLAEIERDMKGLVGEAGAIFDQLEHVTYQSQRDAVWDSLHGSVTAVSTITKLCQMVIDHPEMLKEREDGDA